jgi:hypothetical protein
MAIGITLFIVAVLIVAIYIAVEIKRLRHKVFALFLIALILFTYISFTVTLRGQNVDLGTFSGWATASKLYLAWLGSIFQNLKEITANVIDMDWGARN